MDGVAQWRRWPNGGPRSVGASTPATCCSTRPRRCSRAKGFEGASLDEIADTAGYTRGAIYKHFAEKEELFLAVNKRFNERFLTGFLDLIDPGPRHRTSTWRQIAQAVARAAEPEIARFHVFGTEFNLYVMRNPEVQAAGGRAAARRSPR